jgi:regulator of chromosome condensation
MSLIGKKWFHPKPDTPNPLKDIKKQQDVPMKIHPLNDITTIVCGSSFCLAKTSTGYVYSWGISECGEIGRYCPDLKILGKNEDGESDMIYDTNSILKYHLTPDFMRQIIDNSNDISSKSNIPTKDTVFNKYTSNHLSDVKIIENVKTIGCGSYHSFVIVVGNQVYSCGLNNYAQLGFLDTDSRYLLQKVPSLSNKGLVDAKGGVHHSLVLSYDNKLYSFGRGDSGQLGVKELENKSPGAFSDKALLVRFLTKINNDYEIISYSCGGNHNLALTSDNEVYTWGYGDMLALGHGEDKDETVPKKLNLSKSKVGNITVAQVWIIVT